MKLVYTVRQAHYAAGRFIVQCPSPDGYKTRAARLAEACGGRYVGREHGYNLSAAAVKRFRSCYRLGCDATLFGKITHTHTDRLPVAELRQVEGMARRRHIELF